MVMHKNTQIGSICQASYSVKECKDNKCATLNLSSCEIKSIPEELRAKSLETHLHALNLSSNPLCQLEPCDHFLPTSLRELHLSGCSLRSLPNSLTRLARLQRFFAGANLLSNADVLFRLPSLQHAGLSFNRIEALPRELLPSCTSLLSLDISHNSMTSLGQTFASIQALPNLQVLGLLGNPIYLLPNYLARLQEEIAPRLVYLNGQKLDAVSAIRPQGASHIPRTHSSIRVRQAAVSSDAARTGYNEKTSAGGNALQLGATGGDTNLRIELKNLTLGGAPDPFASLHKLWADELAAAQASGQPATFTLLPPPQPVVYHFELSTFEEEGALGCSSAAEDGAYQQGVQHAGYEGGSSSVPLDRKDASAHGSPDHGIGGKRGDRGRPSPPRSPLGNGHAGGNQAGGNLQPSEERSALAQTQAHPEIQARDAQEGCESPSLSSKSDQGGGSVAGGSPHGSSTAITLASIPLVFLPPEAPVPEQDAAPKGKGAAAKGKPLPPRPLIKPGKGGRGEVPEEQPKLERGCLQAVLPLKANVACRNWLRNGIQLRLYCTRLEAVLTPEALQEQQQQELEVHSEAAQPQKGKGKGMRPVSSEKNRDRPKSGKKDVQEPPAVDMSKYNIVSRTELLGLGTLRAGSSLLKGTDTVYETVTFIPEPALWDAQGMRMALEDPRHSTEAVAELEASLTLHAPMPPMPILPVATPPEKSGRKSPMANSPARSK
uniref:Uncharacterized protein n=1 Tax=Dunaliella tertiolecta TaxID=3047 RepID=A0A7S3QX89_DUNTE|mmetsp:Transcript_20638/g.57581  ORF Transcript_20638/g.57581 Transcript_20638/m.57581 type:complete len:718 (-) Transcript_20638:182-2335(-)